MLEERPLNEVVGDGIRILCKELGLADTARFINRLTAGYGNYTEERGQLFAGMTLEEIVSDIKRERGG